MQNALSRSERAQRFSAASLFGNQRKIANAVFLGQQYTEEIKNLKKGK